VGRIRHISQVLTLVLSNSYWKVISTGHIYSGPLKGMCLPMLSCHACPTAVTTCPVGALQHHAVIRQVPLFLAGLFGLVGLLVGRMGCGWLCPFGLVQDLLYRIPTEKLRLPSGLSVTRYFVLGLLVLMLPYATGEHWFSMLCPAGTASAVIPWAMWNPTNAVTQRPLVPDDALGALFVVKMAILGLFTYLCVMSKRPFCRLICPIGLIFSWFNGVSLLRLEVSTRCNGCDACAERCPVDLKVYQNPNSGQCIRCLACVECAHVDVTLRGIALPTLAKNR
jgi:polyferredoxin